MSRSTRFQTNCLCLLLLSVGTAACGGSREVVRPHEPAPPVVRQQQIPAPRIAPALVDEAATRAFLQQQVELGRSVPVRDAGERRRALLEAEEEIRLREEGYGYYDDQAYAPYYPDDGWAYRGPYRRGYYRSTFPLGTLTGAGVGAAVGRISGRRYTGRGAAIGAGLGLLLDLSGPGRRW